MTVNGDGQVKKRVHRRPAAWFLPEHDDFDLLVKNMHRFIAAYGPIKHVARVVKQDVDFGNRRGVAICNRQMEPDEIPGILVEYSEPSMFEVEPVTLEAEVGS